MRFSDYQHIVWDFNGTILDDVAVDIEVVNLLLERRRLPLIPSREAYREVFGFPIEDYYRRIGFDFTKESYAEVAKEWVIEYRLREPTAPMRDGVLPVLDFISEKGIPQTVISASEMGILREQLHHLGIADRFEKICGIDNIYAASKTALAVSWAKKRCPGRVLMIGDTDHDAETARAAGFDLVLVEGGHMSRSALLKTGAKVFSDFDELLEAFSNDLSF